MTTETVFAKLPDDVVLNIFFKLEEDPRNWARMACVCTKFLSLVTDVCWRNKCCQTMPAVVADLIPTAGADPPGGWAALHKLAVCCPGLLHSGVLLENSDFGLERELGPDEIYEDKTFPQVDQTQSQSTPSSSKNEATSEPPVVSGTDQCSWSLYDDLYFDTVYVAPELQEQEQKQEQEQIQPEIAEKSDKDVVKPAKAFSGSKKRKVCRSLRSHLASGVWNLSREQGNKLLASRFRGDCLYICDWPGCMHMEEKRNYMLFRGVFKDFKRSRVWRTINDGNRSKIDLNCAFCACKQTWDLHSAFCLRRVYGFHDDGEPVVRAYVCENGHVSGAWTDWPLYT